jgi:hypothetical protein
MTPRRADERLRRIERAAPASGSWRDRFLAAVERAVRQHADDGDAVGAVLEEYPDESGTRATVRFLVEVQRRRLARQAAESEGR